MPTLGRQPVIYSISTKSQVRYAPESQAHISDKLKSPLRTESTPSCGIGSQ